MTDLELVRCGRCGQSYSEDLCDRYLGGACPYCVLSFLSDPGPEQAPSDARLMLALREHGVEDALLQECQAEIESAARRGPPPPLAQVALRRGVVSAAELALLLRTDPDETGRPPGRRGPPAGLLGKYRLLGRIGRGGMGEVYLAEDPDLDREVAIKVLRAGLLDEPDLVERTRREAVMAARLDHPGIVTVHEAGMLEGDSGAAVYCIVMDHVPGEDFEARIPNLNLEERLAIFERVVAAIAFAHAGGVVHRDLKPGNILLREDGSPVVTDFGLALDQREMTRLTQEGVCVGTPLYMSPEQAAGRPEQVGPPSDVWALGVILFQLLTDQLPFVGRGVAEVMAQVRRAEIASPRRLARKRGHPVSPELEAICLKALERSRRRRYAHAGELLADLERLAAGEATLARPAGPVRRLTRALRRRLRLILGSLLVVALGLSGWAIQGHLSSRREARRLTARAAQAVEAGRLGEARTLLGRAVGRYPGADVAQVRSALERAEARVQERARLARESRARLERYREEIARGARLGFAPITDPRERSRRRAYYALLKKLQALGAEHPEDPLPDLEGLIGTGWYHLGHLELAISHLRKAVARARPGQPLPASVPYYLACALSERALLETCCRRHLGAEGRMALEYFRQAHHYTETDLAQLRIKAWRTWFAGEEDDFRAVCRQGLRRYAGKDGEEWFHYFSSLQDGHDPAAQLPHLDRAIALRPAHPVFLGRRAMVLLNAGAPGKALEDLETLFQCAPPSGLMLLMRVRSYYRLKKYRQAMRDITKLERVASDDQATRMIIQLWRGRLLARTGDIAGAQRAFEALERAPADLAAASWYGRFGLALRSQGPRAALAVAAAWERAQPRRGTAQLVRGRLFLDRLEEPGRAEQELQRALTSPDLPAGRRGEALVCLARIRFEEGRGAEAWSLALRSLPLLRSSSDRSDAHQVLAQVAEQSDRIKLAWYHVQQAVALGESWELLRLKARLASTQGRHLTAAKVLEQASKLRPDHVETRLARCEALARVKRALPLARRELAELRKKPLPIALLARYRKLEALLKP